MMSIRRVRRKWSKPFQAGSCSRRFASRCGRRHANPRSISADPQLKDSLDRLPNRKAHPALLAVTFDPIDPSLLLGVGDEG